MRILNVILTSVNGGAEKVFLDYCQNLQELGHEVFAIIKADAPYADKLDKLGVKYTKTTNKFGYYDFFAINDIKKAIDDYAIEATISHAGKASVLTRKAIKKSKKRIYQCCVNHSNNIKRSIGADLVINVNKNIFYKTIDSGQDSDKSVIINNAVAVKETSPGKINFDKDIIAIGMMSRLDPHKGYLKMLAVIKNLNKNSSKKFILKIAGDGDYKKIISEHAQRLNISENIEFLGWIDNKKQFFNQIDIFALPSDNETFGLVILEAFNHHVPVIASDTDGAKEIIRHEQEGLLINLKPESQFIDNISRAINHLTENPEQARKITVNAHQRLLKRFSFDNLKMNLRDIFGPKKKL